MIASPVSNTSRTTMQRNTVLPLKLFGYLAAGRAIFGPRSPDTAEILRSGENAELVTAGDLDDAVQRLTALLGDHDRRGRLARAAKATSAQFTWDARAERIKSFLEQRLAAGPSPAPTADPWRFGQWCRETGRWMLGRSQR